MEEEYYKQQNQQGRSLKKQVIVDADWADQVFGKPKDEPVEKKESLLLKKGGKLRLLLGGVDKSTKELKNKKVELLSFLMLGIVMMFVLVIIYYYGVIGEEFLGGNYFVNIAAIEFTLYE